MTNELVRREGGTPGIQEQVEQAGVVHERAGRRRRRRSRSWPAQEQRLLAAMKTLEPTLSDEQHAKVTTVLVELTAYNVMRLLHELQAERARMAFGKA